MSIKLIFDYEQLADYLKQGAEDGKFTAQQIVEASGAPLSLVTALYDGLIASPPINELLAIIDFVYDDTYLDFLKEVQS